MPRASLHIGGRNITARHLFMMGAIVMLVVLNIWRWWPAPNETAGQAKTTRKISLAENEINFLNYIPPDRKEQAVARNLFAPVVEKASYTRPVKVAKQTNKPASKSENRQSELSTFKLEGVLDTDGRVQAFLSRQDDVYMVYRGERVAKAIVVEKITHDGILLKDESSGSSQWVILGGD